MRRRWRVKRRKPRHCKKCVKNEGKRRQKKEDIMQWRKARRKEKNKKGWEGKRQGSIKEEVNEESESKVLKMKG